MDGSSKGRGAARGIAILVVGFLAAGAFVGSPASAGKFLTKKAALRLFYTKSAADARFVNVGEKASDSDKLDGSDSSGFAKIGRSAVGECNPNSSTFVTCVEVTMTLPAAGRVLLIGASDWNNVSNDVVAGDCKLTVDGTQVGPLIEQGELVDTTDTGAQGSTVATAVTDPLGAGSHTFRLECAEANADIDYDNGSLSAVLLGAA